MRIILVTGAGEERVLPGRRSWTTYGFQSVSNCLQEERRRYAFCVEWRECNFKKRGMRKAIRNRISLSMTAQDHFVDQAIIERAYQECQETAPGMRGGNARQRIRLRSQMSNGFVAETPDRKYVWTDPDASGF